MNITPCNHCRFAGDCDIRRDKLAGVRGLKLTSIKFTCQKRRDDLKPGAVVLANLKWVATGPAIEHYPDSPPEPPMDARQMRGYFMAWSQQKARVYVPPDGEFYLWSIRNLTPVTVVRLWPEQLVPTGEIVRHCRRCGMPDLADDATMAMWNCGYDRETGEPEGCGPMEGA